MPRWLYMKRLASNAGRPLPTIAPTLSASSWKDLSESSRCFGLNLDRGSASRPLAEAAKFAI
jgi:hypothetical protein